MTLEDIAFNSIINFLQNNKNFDLLSAHPPSGKSYFTDLIRIPEPIRDGTAAKRYHVDIIFCSDRVLYLCEVKGIADESDDDIAKLKNLKKCYSIQELKKIISDRLTLPSSRLLSVQNIVIAIGATKTGKRIDNEFLYIMAAKNNMLTLIGSVTEEIRSDFNF